MFPVCITGDIDDGREDYDRNIRPLLELLDCHSAKMTVPVTARVLEEHTRKIVAIADAGHEIAGHGDIHTGFRDAVNVQVARLERMCSDFETHLGLRPRGFRAPYLDHNLDTYAALSSVGFSYDSSRICQDPWLSTSAVFNSPHGRRTHLLELPRLWGKYLLGRTPPRSYEVAPGVIELPVFDLDDWFFLDSPAGPKLAPQSAHVITKYWTKALRHFRAMGGELFVIQAHPLRMHRGLLLAVDDFLAEARLLGCEFLTLAGLCKKVRET